jgi:hypothetical protein
MVQDVFWLMVEAAACDAIARPAATHPSAILRPSR